MNHRDEPDGIGDNRTALTATHLRIAELVQGFHGRPETDSETVFAELAEHAAVEIPGAQYAGITLTRNGKHIDTPARRTCGRCCWTRSSSAIWRDPA